MGQNITNENFWINNFKPFSEEVEGKHWYPAVYKEIWRSKQAGTHVHTLNSGTQMGGIWRPRPGSALGKLNKDTVDAHHESCYLMFIFNAEIQPHAALRGLFCQF